MLLENRQTKTT